MPRITIDLLRRRAEHNDGMLSTLEEISLHQEELEKIEVIGSACRRLQILYLQNNIIEKIEDLTHMKELRYLNLALNNISKFEGLQACEFLEKLDLTVNFVDFDELEASIEHLKPLQHLGELYMLGNPCQSNWPDNGFREFVVASLPQVCLLDGKEVHRSDRIKALQVLPERLRYLREQAVRVRADKAVERQRKIEKEAIRNTEDNQKDEDDEEEEENDDAIDIDADGAATNISVWTKKKKKPSLLGSQEKVPYTPHTRREMYLELAEQKEEEVARKRENQPRERDVAREHEQALRDARRREEETQTLRQCNEGKWDFRLFDEALEIILEVDLPRFLDSSLVDVDVHPSYVSMVIKNKLLRLRFPELVHSDKGKAERSKVTGALKLTLPKANVTPTQQLRAQLKKEEEEKRNNAKAKSGSCDASRTKRYSSHASKKLSDELMEVAAKSKGPVNVRGLVKKTDSENEDSTNAPRKAFMMPITTKMETPVNEEEEEDAPPMLF